MSVTVGLDELAAVLDEYGFAYFLTVDSSGRAHAVAVRPVWRDGQFEIGGIGAGTRANAADRPAVVLVWPPRADGGLSLIVDATAEPGDGDRPLMLTPVSAIRHRPA